MRNQVLRGVVHGNVIELKDDSGLSDGTEVEIVVRPTASKASPGDGFLRTEGALADDAEWDAIMEEVHRSRKQAEALNEHT